MSSAAATLAIALTCLAYAAMAQQKDIQRPRATHVLVAVDACFSGSALVRDQEAMVLVPAGDFWMGGEEFDEQKPRHRVRLDAYHIDTYEVSNAEFRAFVDGRGYERQELWSAEGWQWRVRNTITEPAFWRDLDWNEPRQPVVGVSWYEAQAFCRFEGKRLPTEAEWEKAARGTDGRRYPWGESWDASRANSSESRLGKTVAIGSYPAGASPYGALDMAGNVWEWVADWYSPQHNAPGPSTGASKVLRGGSWINYPIDLRSASGNFSPDYRSNFVGFRCAKGL